MSCMPNKHAAFSMYRINLFAIFTFLIVPILWGVSVVDTSSSLFGRLVGVDPLAYFLITAFSLFFLIRVLKENNLKIKLSRLFPLVMIVYAPSALAILFYLLYS